MNALGRWFECQFVRRAIHAYLDGEAPGAGARIEAHLAQCARCRALAQALRVQARAIESLPAEEETPAGFVGRVMERVSAAEGARAPAAGRGWRPVIAAVSAAAALMVIAVAMWAILSRPMQLPVGPTSQPSKVAREGKAFPQVVADDRREPDLVPAPGPTPAHKPEPAQHATAATGNALSRAEEHRDLGRAYEDEGQLDEAFEEYVTARDEGGSQMARLDVARVYEKTGHTAEAVDELIEVAFAEVDENSWEELTVD